MLVYDISSFFLWVEFGVIDRVFRGDYTTRQVYDEGAKAIALSVVSGINCKYSLMPSVSVFYVRLLLHKWTDSTLFNFQQVFLHMGKQAVGKHTLWLELLSIQCQIYLTMYKG